MKINILEEIKEILSNNSYIEYYKESQEMLEYVKWVIFSKEILTGRKLEFLELYTEISYHSKNLSDCYSNKDPKISDFMRWDIACLAICRIKQQYRSIPLEELKDED